MLDKTLFGGIEFLRAEANPYHVLRRFTSFLPNARGVSRDTLDRGQAVKRPYESFLRQAGGQKRLLTPGALESRCGPRVG